MPAVVERQFAGDGSDLGYLTRRAGDF